MQCVSFAAVGRSFDDFGLDEAVAVQSFVLCLMYLRRPITVSVRKKFDFDA